MASILESTGDEIATAARWVYQTLTTDTDVGGLFDATSPMVTGVFEGLAPRGQEYPYITLSLEGGVDIQSVGSVQIALSMLYLVKIVNNDESLGAVSATNKRMHGLLHRGAGEVSNGEVSSSVREIPISYVEVDAGVRYRHYGGHYRIMVQST